MTNVTDKGWQESWPAPAKLNLLLRIVGRRDDGYHLLQTVFQFIDAADHVSFSPRRDSEIRLTSLLPGVAETDDLTVRAARLLQDYSGTRHGVDITVTKNLPMGGGIGGGSSDAATVISVLNRLWGLNYPDEELRQLTLNLGADIPVFIYGRSAWAEGVGELLRPIAPEESWYVVLVPDCQVSTREIFSAGDLTRNNLPITIERFTSGFSCNDCLPVVTLKYPEVRQALSDLSGFGDARLTGTGGCVFLSCDSRARAESVASKLAAKYRLLVTRGCNYSPLRRKMDAVFGISARGA